MISRYSTKVLDTWEVLLKVEFLKLEGFSCLSRRIVWLPLFLLEHSLCCAAMANVYVQYLYTYEDLKRMDLLSATRLEIFFHSATNESPALHITISLECSLRKYFHHSIPSQSKYFNKISLSSCAQISLDGMNRRAEWSPKKKTFTIKEEETHPRKDMEWISMNHEIIWEALLIVLRVLVVLR